MVRGRLPDGNRVSTSNGARAEAGRLEVVYGTPGVWYIRNPGPSEVEGRDFSRSYCNESVPASGLRFFFIGASSKHN
jgi:hypothetical protein